MDISTDGFAVVTGAGNGIGAATAIALAQNGAKGVCLADVDANAAKATAQKSEAKAALSEYRAIPVYVDVSEETSVQAMMNRAVAEFGRVDYLINCAGVRNPTDIRQLCGGLHGATLTYN